MRKRTVYGILVVFSFILLTSGCSINAKITDKIQNTTESPEEIELIDEVEADTSEISEGVPVSVTEEWRLDVSYAMPEGHEEISSFDAEGHETIILVSENVECAGDLELVDCERYSATVIIEAAPVELCVFEDGILKYANTNVNAVEIFAYEELKLERSSILFGEARTLVVNKTDYNALMEQGVELSEEELFCEHWCAFFGKENGDRAIMVLLRKDFFDKDEAVQWLQQMNTTEQTFCR